MTEIVLDASALLAMLLEEPGGDEVAAQLDGALMSSVNLAEVVGHYARHGADRSAIETMLSDLPFTIIPFDANAAFEIGLMQPAASAAGLSLGDRACLSLARAEGRLALTADRAWAKIADRVGVAVEIIR